MGSGRVLVAARDDALRGVTANVLVDAGFDVSEATSVDAALDEAVRSDPDIIVLDHSPLLAAENFLREYRRRPRSRARIAVLTAGSLERIVEELGIDASLVKPFDVDELITSLRELMHTVRSHAV